MVVTGRGESEPPALQCDPHDPGRSGEFDRVVYGTFIMRMSESDPGFGDGGVIGVAVRDESGELGLG